MEDIIEIEFHNVCRIISTSRGQAGNCRQIGGKMGKLIFSKTLLSFETESLELQSIRYLPYLNTI